MVIEFNGCCLKQDKVTFNHGKIVNIYIVYKISRNFNISNYPALENCLFGAVSLTNMLMLISINIMHMKLDFIEEESFHLVMVLVKM